MKAKCLLHRLLLYFTFSFLIYYFPLSLLFIFLCKTVSSYLLLLDLFTYFYWFSFTFVSCNFPICILHYLYQANRKQRYVIKTSYEYKLYPKRNYTLFPCSLTDLALLLQTIYSRVPNSFKVQPPSLKSLRWVINYSNRNTRQRSTNFSPKITIILPPNELQNNGLTHTFQTILTFTRKHMI